MFAHTRGEHRDLGRTLRSLSRRRISWRRRHDVHSAWQEFSRRGRRSFGRACRRHEDGYPGPELCNEGHHSLVELQCAWRRPSSQPDSRHGCFIRRHTDLGPHGATCYSLPAHECKFAHDVFPLQHAVGVGGGRPCILFMQRFIAGPWSHVSVYFVLLCSQSQVP